MSQLSKRLSNALGWLLSAALVNACGGFGNATAVPTPPVTPTTPDGMVEVYIPEGEFLMGTTYSLDPFNLAEGSETPQHTVYLDAFWIDQTEVTNAQYAQCVQAGGCVTPAQTDSRSRTSYYGNSAFDNYPVVHVSWAEAQAYCTWAGRGLPSEAQWEKAARGTAGRIYPWGNEEPSSTRLNYNHFENDTTEVGLYVQGASPYGVLDMAGNVMEWVNDWYGGYDQADTRNPKGPGAGQERVLRGGSFQHAAKLVRAAKRMVLKPTDSDYDIGFRCALSR